MLCLSTYYVAYAKPIDKALIPHSNSANIRLRLIQLQFDFKFLGCW